MARCTKKAYHKFHGGHKKWTNVPKCCKYGGSYYEQVLYYREAYGLHKKRWASKYGANYSG